MMKTACFIVTMVLLSLCMGQVKNGFDMESFIVTMAPPSLWGMEPKNIIKRDIYTAKVARLLSMYLVLRNGGLVVDYIERMAPRLNLTTKANGI